MEKWIDKIILLNDENEFKLKEIFEINGKIFFIEDFLEFENEL